MLRINNGLKIAGLVLAYALVASAAQADTICVKAGGGGGCEATIQDAVDAAGPGDTIKLRPGVYFENVDIGSGLDGLTIVGDQDAILDAGDDGVTGSPNTGSGIFVDSNDVVIKGFTFRGGDSYHIEIGDAVTGTWIESIYSINPESDAVASSGSGNDDTTVIKSTFLHADSSAIDIDGDNVFIMKNLIRHTSSDGIYVSGDGVVIERNTLVGVENGDAIYVSGDGSEVVSNRIRAVDDAGIDVDGDDALVANNKVRGTYGGIEVSGERLVVRNNRLRGTVSGSEAIDVNCFTDCTGAKVSRNRVLDTGDDTDSFEIDASAPGMLIARNVAKDGIDYGMDLSIDGAKLRNNRIISTGGDEEDCFNVSGDDNVLVHNIAALCMGAGFYVSGNNNELRRNRATQAGEDGFYISNGSDATILRNNRAFDNGFSGILIRDGAPAASNTVVTKNRASGNRHDFCNDGTGTVESGNKFDIVLAVTQNGTNDCPTF